MKTLENNLRYEVREDEQKIYIKKFKNDDEIIERFFDKNYFEFDHSISIEENLQNFSKKSYEIGFMINNASMILNAQSKYWVYFFNGRYNESSQFLGHFDSIGQVIIAIERHKRSNTDDIEYSARYNIGDRGFIRNICPFMDIEKQVKDKLMH